MNNMRRYLGRPIRHLLNTARSLQTRELLAKRWESEFGRISYAQEGEDLLISELLDRPADEPGFYVDVGAHHPVRFSNTYLFYLRGWCGINIDATPGVMSLFRENRCRDTNIECAIGREASTRTFYIFNEPALNSFDEKLSRSRDGMHGYRITSTVEIPSQPLQTLLDQYVPPNVTIDFMTVDVEGADLEVLDTVDWSKTRPRLLVTEILDNAGSPLGTDSQTSQYMVQRGYQMISRMCRSALFRDMEARP